VKVISLQGEELFLETGSAITWDSNNFSFFVTELDILSVLDTELTLKQGIIKEKYNNKNIYPIISCLTSAPVKHGQ
jgi:hypothetical protein